MDKVDNQGSLLLRAANLILPIINSNDYGDYQIPYVPHNLSSNQNIYLYTNPQLQIFPPVRQPLIPGPPPPYPPHQTIPPLFNGVNQPIIQAPFRNPVLRPLMGDWPVIHPRTVLEYASYMLYLMSSFKTSNEPIVYYSNRYKNRLRHFSTKLRPLMKIPSSISQNKKSIPMIEPADSEEGNSDEETVTEVEKGGVRRRQATESEDV